jgi:radical SAM protein with 4Fe4S-binding SPASM domain
MDLELLDKMLFQISRVDEVKQIFFVGAGETLLHPKFIEILELTEKHNIHNRIKDRLLFTNTTLLTTEKSLVLCNSPIINKLVFSIDGLGTKETYEYIRRKSSWEKVRNNIINFIEIYKKTNRFPIDYYIRPVIPSDYTDLPFNPISTEEIMKNFKGNFGSDIRIELVPSHSYDGKKELRGVKRSSTIDNNCWRVESGDFNFTYDGQVLPCCHLMVKPTQEAIIGNINTQTIEEIYWSEKYQHIKNTLAANRRDKLQVCKDCTLCAFPIASLRNRIKNYIKNFAKTVLPHCITERIKQIRDKMYKQGVKQ